MDGPVSAEWLKQFVSNLPAPVSAALPAGEVLFQAPRTHAGCLSLALSNCSTGVNSLGFRILIVDLFQHLKAQLLLDCSRLFRFISQL